MTPIVHPAASSTAQPPKAEASPLLPPRDGVGASTLVLPQGAWPTLLDFLAERFPSLSRDEIVRRCRARGVLDAAGEAIDAGAAYRAGTRVFYYRHVDDEPVIPFSETILYQDERILVADKPHFLPMSPVGNYAKETLLARLKRRTGIDTLAPMHRLDRETAGVVAFTVQPALRGAYQRLFADGQVAKVYEAIAPHRPELTLPRRVCHRIVPDAHFMRMRVVDGEPNAETWVERIESCGILARYRLTPRTGKKHQLRVQMAEMGMPIVGDTIYPVFRDSVDFASPLQLIARHLAFRDPVDGTPREFESARAFPNA